MGKRGRKTKLTPETTERMVQAITLGATYELACQYAGIDYSTFSLWMAAAERGEEKYFNFFNAIKEAEGKATVTWLAMIQKAAAEGSWQAAAWKLERRYPQSYGRSVVDVNANVNINVKAMTDDELEKIARGET